MEGLSDHRQETATAKRRKKMCESSLGCPRKESLILGHRDPRKAREGRHGGAELLTAGKMDYQAVEVQFGPRWGRSEKGSEDKRQAWVRRRSRRHPVNAFVSFFNRGSKKEESGNLRETPPRTQEHQHTPQLRVRSLKRQSVNLKGTERPYGSQGAATGGVDGTRREVADWKDRSGRIAGELDVLVGAEAAGAEETTGNSGASNRGQPVTSRRLWLGAGLVVAVRRCSLGRRWGNGSGRLLAREAVRSFCVSVKS